MANYPYVSGAAATVGLFNQLRKGFPSKVDAGYLQRFSIGKGNESYLLAIIRFLGLIDDDGNRVEDNTAFFYGDDETFKSGLESTLQAAYSQLFDEMGNGAFEAERGALTAWFRAADKTSDLVGGRQAGTFQVMAALAGHGQVPTLRTSTSKSAAGTATKTASKKAAAAETPGGSAAAPAKSTVQATPAPAGAAAAGSSAVGLTVRVEINLPAGGDADTYDAIFASIRKHLMQ